MEEERKASESVAHLSFVAFVLCPIHSKCLTILLKREPWVILWHCTEAKLKVHSIQSWVSNQVLQGNLKQAEIQLPLGRMSSSWMLANFNPSCNTGMGLINLYNMGWELRGMKRTQGRRCGKGNKSWGFNSHWYNEVTIMLLISSPFWIFYFVRRSW